MINNYSNKEIINYLKIGDLILNNYNKEFINAFNYNHITIFVGDNLRERLKKIFDNKIYFNDINNETKYVIDFLSNGNFTFISIDKFLSKRKIIKVYNIINYELLTINQYQDIILQNKLVDNIIYKYFHKKLSIFSFNRTYCFMIIFKTLEELLNINFKKRLFYYNEFILYNNNYFNKKFITTIEM
jgi:hypothetical protein